MKLTDGAFVAVKDGRLVLGHVDRPFTLWQVDPGVLVVLAEIARGTTAQDLPEALAPLTGLDRHAAAALLGHLRGARVVADEPGVALRDVHAEIAKVVSAAPDLDHDHDFLEAAWQCEDLTLTSAAAQYALWSAVGHIVGNAIPGAVVECGVWRGGSMLLAALALLNHHVEDRDLYLFDTFDWAWEPAGGHDGMVGAEERTTGAEAATPEHMSSGTSAAEIHKRITTAGYPGERVHCVTGFVQDTVPGNAPDRIALLRLDTDQYESTLHELRELYPRVVPHGVVIVDDYGKLSGATQATDEYLAGLDHRVLLHRIDTQGRVFVKPAER
ncbi:TylF/MycF/NovP-related O-methyltransferase [Streptosporangium sp. NPDC001559]|uniref:TylF/MycF/NovP-related O-methyltransferase n=1 Tax=Streptosporangium sp. NPDC001559 TaxID=3366187 RepID=UPI0036EFE7B9